MMEYWNVALVGLEEWDLFYKDGTDQNSNSDHHLFLVLNIPLFHSSICELSSNLFRFDEFQDLIFCRMASAIPNNKR